jgi:ABC-2 type transport system ATP-binding protein
MQTVVCRSRRVGSVHCLGLDPVALAEIRTLIATLKNDHTIIFSTHQLHDVELLCSDITLINHGKIVVSGPLNTILENLKTRMIIEARVENFNESLKIKMMNLEQMMLFL